MLVAIYGYAVPLPLPIYGSAVPLPLPYMVSLCPLPLIGEMDPTLGQQLAVIDLKPWHKRDLEIRPLADRYVPHQDQGAWQVRQRRDGWVGRWRNNSE